MAIRKRNGVEAAGALLMLNKMNSTASKIRLGDVLEGQKGSAKAKYDFAVLGGAVGTLSLRDPNDSTQAVTLPNKAIITNVIIDVITAMTSTGNNGTIALNANSAGDLLAAVDADTLSAIHAGIPVGTAATSVKLTAERTLQVTIATNALLSGKFIVHVEYMISE
jgi:hypothetical protein